MGIQFNIDLSARRKQQQALAKLDAQRQQSEDLRQAAFGTIEAGPPTRFGEQSVSGGQLAPNPFVEQLFGRQDTAGEGIKQTLALLEQQRKNEVAQTQQAGIQNAIGTLPQGSPELEGLKNLFLATGGENRDVGKALGQQFAPFSLSGNRFTGTGKKIVGVADYKPSTGSGIKSFAPVVIVNKLTQEKRLVAPTFDPADGTASFSEFDLPQGFEISKETPFERRTADTAEKIVNQRVIGDLKGDQDRFKELRSVTASRQASIGKATKFLSLFQKRNFSSGAGRSTLSYLPGVYTDQGRLDEEFNAFAEIAARQALKAAGETKPTDDDVKGMKNAMFGIGRDESVNLKLLQDYLNQQQFDEDDYQRLKPKKPTDGLPNTGELPPPPPAGGTKR